MSVNNTSPASLFGGTWEKIQDRFLLASGSSYSLGATGGEKEHTLTINEMPSHSHNARFLYVHSGNYWVYMNARGSSSDTYSIKENALEWTGGSRPHNNMPPYLVVNVWKRIS